MKPGRNDTCPCGSGKKYKHCHCPEGRDGTVEENSVNKGDAPDDGLSEEQEFLIKAFNGLRSLMLKNNPHIKEYYRIRKIHSEVVDAMIQYHDKGKFTQKIGSDYAAGAKRGAELRLLEFDFDLETHEGVQAFYDMLIYKSALNMNCITEDFIQSRHYRKPEKIDFLHSMLESRLGLFEVTETDLNAGYAYIKEVFTGDEYKIIDVGLSGSPHYGEHYIYTRIITYQGISFGTGFNLTFMKTDEFIKKHIEQHRKDYRPTGEFIRFTQLYNHYSASPDRVKVVVNEFK